VFEKFVKVELLREKLRMLEAEKAGDTKSSPEPPRVDEEEDKDMCIICWEQKINTVLLEVNFLTL
jgi:hypothetical protein